LAAEGIQSSLILPLRSKGHIIGTWNLGCRQIGIYSPDDLPMVQALADQLAVAIENAHLYKQAQQELSERQRAETALRESEARYRTLVETSPDAIMLTDLQGRILFCNQKSAGLYMVRSVAEVLGKTVFEWITPEDLPRAVDNMNRILKAGSLNSVEYTLVKKNSARFPGEISTSVLQDRAGQPQGFITVIRDITERKRAEARLRLLESAVVNAKDAVLITEAELFDPPGPAILYANEAFTRMTGYSLEEVLGKTPRILQGPKTDRDELDKIRTALGQQQPVQVELINYRKDGSEYWVELNIVPVADAQGHLTHLVSVQREVTERRHLEAQLRQSQKMEAVGQLAGGIAHDFNNLLTVITGYSELALKRHLNDNDPLRPYIEEIDRAGERAAGLTRQLLAFSRKQVLELKVLNLNTVVAEMDKMLRRLIGEDVDLVTMLNEDLGQVKADPGQLEQVIMNLAVNARDAMPQGGKLTIETANVELDETYAHQHLEAQPGSYVMLAVSDTGAGMDPETMSHIFEPVFTTKEQGKGTGLGLSTLYGIVKQSGGHTWVYSEIGRGTTFKVYLPRVEESVEIFEPDPVRLKQHQAVETILLVEDEERVRELVRTLLQEEGYTVLVAQNGDEALRLCQQYDGPAHLLVTDMVMPGGMNGRQLAERLTSLYPKLKVLYMSGYTGEAIVRQGVLEHNLAFLQKPFSLVGLIRKVREVLASPPSE
jgi:PAS domain S-box-containing protein